VPSCRVKIIASQDELAATPAANKTERERLE
jgi:hypothetical protein